MIINRERDSCFGRGFTSANTILNLLWDPAGGGPPNGWIDRAINATPVSKSIGGAGWHVIEDGTAEAEPYIVVSNHTAANVAANPNRFDEPHKILKIIQSYTGSRFVIEAYLWWDVGALPPQGTGYGLWASAYVATVDDGPFVYDFRGGPEFIALSANNNESWSTFVLGDWFADSSTKWFPYDKTVASAVVNNPTGTGASAFVELADATEVNRFEVGEYYYLTDYNGVEKAEYVKVTAKDITGPTYGVTVEQINSTAFAVGSVLAAYAHRFYCFFTNKQVTGTGKYDQVIPYCSNYSNKAYVTGLNEIKNEFTGSIGLLNVMQPDDEGNYAVEEPFVGEDIDGSNGSDEMNNTLGKCVGCWMSSINGLTKMQIGRTIEDPPGNPLNFMYMENREGFAFLAPDYDSTT